MKVNQSVCIFLSLFAGTIQSPAQQSGGYLDSLSTLAEGWGIYAPLSNQTCLIQFYADGSLTNGQFLGQVETLVERPDVNSFLGISGTHGFSYAIPLSLWDGNWITGFSQQAGFNLAFFHLDVDLEAARVITPDLSVLSEIPQLAAFCKARGIPFGVIIWQANVQLPVDSNRAFCDSALYWAQILHSVCDVDQAIVQSWEQYPDQNVPDSQPYTFTQLLIDYTAKIASVPFPNPDVAMYYPGQITIHGRAGASYNIETVQDLGLSNIWQNAATVLMGTSDAIWMDPTQTNVTKFYRVIGNH